MGLVANTILWACINIFLALFIASGINATVEYQESGQLLNDTDTTITLGDLNILERYQASFAGTGMPATLIWILTVLNGLWLAMIIVGWVRGQH